ncbi:MAG: sigma-70 family RNA polymerase sigma factor [Clostridium sp.]|uniref:sigma-70 family RNA polymerase sigma factor n=1 Tax=Clostridium sp. TaxID=1506 RepID=UPI0029020490|nr:sigma-70 family RNA polymerase sigma factor [Clostridium sp.]MDU1586853.1 sigma-70 family RNA polymerase sigma factor [Clostridium sp.]
MNEELILKLVEPYVKDGYITYKQFDNIFNFLSRKEQYIVSDLLFIHNINLCDESNQKIILENHEKEIGSPEIDYDSKEFEILYDENLFKDSKSISNQSNNLMVNRKIKQSNEILCTLIQDGNLQAKQDLCVKNKKLVDKYAIPYTSYYGNHLDFEDIEQVGFLGLIKAAEKFDVSKGNAFSTYAVYWIRQAIVREIYDNGFAIRIPVHMMDHINKVTRLDNSFAVKGIRYEERLKLISDEIGYPQEFVEQCLVIRRNYLSYSSLDIPIGEEEEMKIGEVLTDKEVPLVEEIVESHLLREALENAISTLKEREEEVLRLRYGFDDGRQRTLEEVGHEFNVTRERIRQIEAKALSRLRHPSRSRKLKDFL